MMKVILIVMMKRIVVLDGNDDGDIARNDEEDSGVDGNDDGDIDRNDEEDSGGRR